MESLHEATIALSSGTIADSIPYDLPFPQNGDPNSQSTSLAELCRLLPNYFAPWPLLVL